MTEFIKRDCLITSTREKRSLVPRTMESEGRVRRVVDWEDPETGDIFPSEIVKQIPRTPYKEFGVECGEGWSDLIKPLFDYVEEYNKAHADRPIEVEQVKEKFGGLRFYTNFETKELAKMIEQAENESYRTCEICGSKENVGMTHGWLSVRCRKCLEQWSVGGYGPNWTDNATNKKYRFEDGKAIEMDSGDDAGDSLP